MSAGWYVKDRSEVAETGVFVRARNPLRATVLETFGLRLQTVTGVRRTDGAGEDTRTRTATVAEGE
jgi:hypothetical protein